jgi:hypothetical protein
MANGTPALKLMPAPEPLPKDAGRPSANPLTEIEITLGAAVADAAAVISLAVVDFGADGALAPATRVAGGEALARVCMIRLDHFGEIDFTAAGAEAKRLLRQRHGMAWRAEYGTEIPEAMLNTLVGWALNITEKVVADERALLTH